jgi:hypothetical protein
MANLNELYNWFDSNRDDIISGHDEDECVLLKDASVVGYYPNTQAALSAARKSGFILGDFLIQDCIPHEQDCITYYNRAVCFG